MKKIRRRYSTFGRNLLTIIIVVPFVMLATTFCINLYIMKGLVYERESLRFHSRLEFKARQLNEFFEKVAALPRSLAIHHHFPDHNVLDEEILENTLRSAFPECHAIVVAFEEDVPDEAECDARVHTRKGSIALGLRSPRTPAL